jgi:microcompartment protein CcmK/EutM
MKLGQVVGTIVLSQCIDPYRGRALYLVQDLNEALELTGDPEVSATWQACLEGDQVIVEVAREACNAFDPPLPIDAVILGKVDHVHIEDGL